MIRSVLSQDDADGALSSSENNLSVDDEAEAEEDDDEQLSSDVELQEDEDDDNVDGSSYGDDDQADEEQDDDEGEADEDDDCQGEAISGSTGGKHRSRPLKRRTEPEVQRLPVRTNKAKVQENERLDGSNMLPNTKPMMELEAGSNIWYQAYVLKESINEAKVRFPNPNANKHDLLRTWVKKASSRVWRGSYANSDWQHLGKGAWKPREKPKRGARGSGRRGADAAGSHRRGSRATRSEGGISTGQQYSRGRKALRGTGSEVGQSDDDQDDEGASEGEGESSDGSSAAQESDNNSEAAPAAQTNSTRRHKPQQQQQPLRKTLSAPPPSRQQQQQPAGRGGSKGECAEGSECNAQEVQGSNAKQQVAANKPQKRRVTAGLDTSGSGDEAATDTEGSGDSRPNKRRNTGAAAAGQQQGSKGVKQQGGPALAGSEGRLTVADAGKDRSGAAEATAAGRDRQKGSAAGIADKHPKQQARRHGGGAAAGNAAAAGQAGSSKGNDGVRDDDAVSAGSTHSDLQGLFVAAGAGLAHQQPTQQLADPLARWFEVHYTLLSRAGCFAPSDAPGNLESGKLPSGFMIDPTSSGIQHVSVLQQQARSILQALPAPTAAAVAAAAGVSSSGIADGNELGGDRADSAHYFKVAGIAGDTATAAAAAGGAKRPGAAAGLPQPAAKRSKGSGQQSQVSKRQQRQLVGGSNAHRRAVVMPESDDSDDDNMSDGNASSDSSQHAGTPPAAVTQHAWAGGDVNSSNPQWPASLIATVAGAAGHGSVQQHRQQSAVPTANQGSEKWQREQIQGSAAKGTPLYGSNRSVNALQGEAAAAAGASGSPQTGKQKHGPSGSKGAGARLAVPKQQGSGPCKQPVAKPSMASPDVKAAAVLPGAAAAKATGGTSNRECSAAKPPGALQKAAGVMGSDYSVTRPASASADVGAAAAAQAAAKMPPETWKSSGGSDESPKASAARNKQGGNDLLKPIEAGRSTGSGQPAAKQQPTAAAGGDVKAVEPSVSCNSRSDGPGSASGLGNKSRAVTSQAAAAEFSAAPENRSGITGGGVAAAAAAARRGKEPHHYQQQRAKLQWGAASHVHNQASNRQPAGTPVPPAVAAANQAGGAGDANGPRAASLSMQASSIGREAQIQHQQLQPPPPPPQRQQQQTTPAAGTAKRSSASKPPRPSPRASPQISPSTSPHASPMREGSNEPQAAAGLNLTTSKRGSGRQDGWNAAAPAARLGIGGGWGGKQCSPLGGVSGAAGGDGSRSSLQGRHNSNQIGMTQQQAGGPGQHRQQQEQQQQQRRQQQISYPPPPPAGEQRQQQWRGEPGVHGRSPPHAAAAHGNYPAGNAAPHRPSLAAGAGAEGLGVPVQYGRTGSAGRQSLPQVWGRPGQPFNPKKAMLDGGGFSNSR